MIAVATGDWYMQQIYDYAYAPLCALMLFLRHVNKEEEIHITQ